MKVEFLRGGLVLVSALLLTLADAIIKVQSGQPGFALFSKWMLCSYVLYLAQVVLSFWLFRTNAEFTVYVNLFVLTYGIACLIVGTQFFGDTLNNYQKTGIALGFVSALLLNVK